MGHYSTDRPEHPVRPFLLRMADYLERRDSEHDGAWATMIRRLVAEHDVTGGYGFWMAHRVAGEQGDWDVSTDRYGECKTACGSCSDFSGSDEHVPQPHPCPTLLAVALVFRHVDGFDPAWLPPDVVAGELAPPGLEAGR